MKKQSPKSKRYRECNTCGESKPKWLFSSSEYTCIACKQVMYGQGLQAIHTTITNEVKQ